MNDEQKAFIDELLGNVSHGAPDKEIRVRQFMQRVFGDRDNRKREVIRPIVQDLIDGNYESYNRWISQPRNKGQAKVTGYLWSLCSRSLAPLHPLLDFKN